MSTKLFNWGIRGDDRFIYIVIINRIDDLAAEPWSEIFVFQNN